MPTPLLFVAELLSVDDVETEEAETTRSISSLRRPGARWPAASSSAASSSRSTSSRRIATAELYASLDHDHEVSKVGCQASGSYCESTSRGRKGENGSKTQ